MRWQRFIYVTLPQLASVLFVIVLLRSIWMFTKFDTPWLMIQGGGAETYIRTLPIYTYMRTFAYYEAGLGSAMAVVMFLELAGGGGAVLPHLAARGRSMSRCLAPAEPARPGGDAGRLGAARLHGVPVRLDGLDRVQAFAGDFRRRRRRSGPRTFTLDNLSRLFAETRFLTYFRNSLAVSLADCRIDLAGFGARRLQPHALSLSRRARRSRG